MSSTRLFKDTVKARIGRDSVFAAALFEETLFAFFEGDNAVGEALLRDHFNFSVGLEGQTRKLNKPS
jgi:hypothetical protein